MNIKLGLRWFFRTREISYAEAPEYVLYLSKKRLAIKSTTMAKQSILIDTILLSV